MNYDKQDAIMTKGLAIVSMLLLHLFCRVGKDVFGTPLLWVSKTTPFVAWIGFMAEFCMPLYSICCGYAYSLLSNSHRNGIRNRCIRIMHLMIIYWTVLFLFSLLGILIGSESIPGTIRQFVFNIVLYKSYNGAWWFLHTYVFLLLMPSAIVLFVEKHFSFITGMFFCFIFGFCWYLYGKFGGNNLAIYPEYVQYCVTELSNIIRVLPYVWIGTILCKHDIVRRVDIWLEERWTVQKRNRCIFLFWIILFFGINFLHKAILSEFSAVLVFLSFNLWIKPRTVKRVFLFLGRHSTNIWLSHMFFYLYFFNKWMDVVKYPIFIFASLLGMCLLTSIVLSRVQTFCLKCIGFVGLR